MNYIIIIYWPQKSLKLVKICCQIINIENEFRIEIGGVNKLAPNLGSKSKYVIHYRNL